MAYTDEDLLQLSGLQHFSYCRRQWALIHLEQLWQENWRTTEGNLMHRRAHNTQLRERRGDVLTIRGLSVVSRSLGISGQCDVVEFHRTPDGIPLRGEEGLWLPYPVEYKHGAPKETPADRLQLCAQAMCLEEMLCCSVPEGALYYGETRRRCVVALYVGFLHQDRPGRIALALDLMEELRPCLADRFVLTLINNRVFQKNDFEFQESGAVTLSESARKEFLTRWQARKKEQLTHPYLKEKLPWGLVPYIQAQLLARYLRNDLEEYPPGGISSVFMEVIINDGADNL